MRRSTLIGRFLLVVMVVVALTGTSPAAPAQALAGPDYAIAWNGTVAPRSMPIPGLAGGYLQYRRRLVPAVDPIGRHVARRVFSHGDRGEQGCGTWIDVRASRCLQYS